MRLTFDADHIRRLLELSRSADRRVPVLKQLVDPEMWRRDLPETRRAMLEREVAQDGLAFSARSEDVDQALIGPGLILVGDQGVYLMSNAPIESVKAAGVSHVAYAAEADPTALPFEAWWDCAIRRIRSAIPITSGHALRSSGHRATLPLSVIW